MKKGFFADLLTKLVFALIIVWLAPLIWLFLMSVKPNPEILVSPTVWITSHPTLVHYQNVLFGSEFSDFLRNSAIISLSTTALTLALACPAAYSFAKFTGRKAFRGSVGYLNSLIIMRGLPGFVLIIPLFVMYTIIHMMDSKIGMTIAYTAFALPLAVWILRAFFLGVPPELMESAEVDGCSRLGAFIRIAIPLSTSGIATAGVLTFLLAWNDFIFALVLTSTSNARTATIGIFNFIGTGSHYMINWGEIGALAVILVAPILLFVLFAHRYIVKGLTFGAVKG